jgi:bifunctional ADP-heptose synthase (sugar kinase/adenylyltransferase)
VDTRSKILDIARFSELQGNGHRLITVRGHFDVLTGTQVRRLTELRKSNPDARLAVILGNPTNPLLDAKARAELVAALESVDYVFIAGAEQPATFSEEAAHAAETTRLINHVQRRHNS